MSANNTKFIGVLVGACALVTHCLAVDTAADLDKAVNGSGKAQLKAIAALGSRHENASSVVPELRELLKSDEPQVRWHSARAIGEYGSLAKDSAPKLVKLLKDKDRAVQYHAAIALGKVDDKSDDTVSALVEAATSNEPSVARAAIAALRHLKPGPQRVTAALKVALKSNDQAETLHALEAIVEQRGKAVPLLKETLKEPATMILACAAIEQIGPEAAGTVAELTEILRQSKHSNILIQALLALASIGPAAAEAESAIAPLVDFKTDKTVPVAAVYALGAIGAKNSDDAIKKAAEKNEPLLHMVADWALAKHHPEDAELMKNAVDDLTKGLSNKDPKMRAAAAKGLQMLQPPAEMVAPELIAMGNDPDPEVSANVVGALAGLGESIVPRAKKALHNPSARDLTLRVLTKLGPKAGGAVPTLIEVAKDANPELCKMINLTLADIGPAAAPATAMLAECVGNSDKGVRESALLALRQIGPGAKAATRRLTRKMESDHSFESMAAAWALARIGGDDSDMAAKVLPVLKRGLASSDEQTRLNSVDALEDLGSAAEAKKELKKLSQEDSSAAVREAAAAALKNIRASS